ncbi:MAG TPA: EAL domain-containing protein, partial [Bauldia sp.]|nr:EAL domain-containing protein [Bauldia sp.]
MKPESPRLDRDAIPYSRLSLPGATAFRGILDAIPHPVFVKDNQTRFIVINEMMCELMGRSSQEVAGKTDYDFFPREQADIYRGNDLRVLNTGVVNENEEFFTDITGKRRTIVTRKRRLELPSGECILVGCITDISDFRDVEAVVRHQAEHDPLTGLANRRVFYAAINEALGGQDADSSILLLDLDRFKPINDIHGHTAGDAVLCEIAERLKGLVRSGDVVARLGGDEFGIIVRSNPGKGDRFETLVAVARRINEAVAKPVAVGGRWVQVGASIGIADCGVDGTDAEEILHAADIAMYRAKEDGRGTVRFFERAMDEHIRRQATFEADLRAAIASGEVTPHYQPLVALADKRIVGFEILARWNHPVHGAVPPSDFIPVAEQSGMIGELTYALLRTACLDAQQWPEGYGLSLNISPVQLRDQNMPSMIGGILAAFGFPPELLEVEVTENAIVADLEAARSVIAALRSLGVRIALDDFGTGYAGLYHLRQLTFDKIKIDRSFILSLATEPESTRIVNAILALTRSLGLPTTAEGLETIELVS